MHKLDYTSIILTAQINNVRKKKIVIIKDKNRRCVHILKISYYLEYNSHRLENNIARLPITLVMLYKTKLRIHKLEYISQTTQTSFNHL